MGGATGQNTRGTVLCQWGAREPGRARGVKVRGGLLGVLTISKVEVHVLRAADMSGPPRMEVIREGGKTPRGVAG